MTQPATIKLLNRSCTVTVGTTQISRVGQQLGLDVWFSVKRSLKAGEPNTCDLRLYNIAPATREAIEASSQPLAAPGGGPQTAVPVQIVAGYIGNTSTIFLGELRSAQTITDGPNTVTELTSGDGDQAVVLARSTASFAAAGGNAYAVAQQLLSDMQCGVGNLATVASVLKASPLYQKGVALKGCSNDLLRNLARSCGIEVTIQAGVAQWCTLGQPLGGQAYSLSSSTGLIGSPSVDTKGVLSGEVLMVPGFAPGLPVVMNAKFVQGLFRLTSVETVGDTGSNEWSHRFEAKRYGLAA